MTFKKNTALVSAVAVISALGTVVDAGMASAQSAQGGYQDNGYPNNGYPNGGYPNNGYPNGQYDQGYDRSQAEGYPDNAYDRGRAAEPAPPQGQYAPPPTGYEQPGVAYDYRAQQYDRDYADRYSRWAAQYCIDRRNNNTAAGAVIGGVLGAIIGSGVAGRGDRGAGAVVGGALGAGTGAIIGSNSSTGGPGGCPPGYYVRPGAPAFYYSGPVYGVITGPAWYNPWVWTGGSWVYRPYRYWYFNHRSYWRPGWRPGAYRWYYRHW